MAEENNPFALGRAGAGPRAPAAARDYTPAEQLDLLRGYLRVPPDLYAHIDADARVRYYTTDKTKNHGFRIGGYVVNVIPGPPDAPPAGLYLSSVPRGQGVGATGWPVKFANVEKVFVKMPLAWHLARHDAERSAATKPQLQQVAAEILSGVNDRVQQLDARLRALERRR